MAQFPDSPKPSYPLVIEPEWKTITSLFDSGAEQRRQKWDFAKYNVTLTFKTLTASEMQTLWDFYQARKGSYEDFYYYVPYSANYDNLYVGQGDGSTTTFDIPGKSTSSQVIYIDDVLQSSGYSILTGGGSENSDRVQFTSAPVAGEVITCDFTGYMRIRCRFEQDKMSREWFSYVASRTGLKLKGL